MYGDGIHGPVVKNYARLLEQVVKGATGIIEEDSAPRWGCRVRNPSF
jgi:hypothetical protein